MTSTVLDRMAASGAEQIMWNCDESVGLSMITIVHGTVLGPALGGIRMHAYPDELAALDDGFRLARAMTLTAACTHCLDRARHECGGSSSPNTDGPSERPSRYGPGAARREASGRSVARQ